MSAAPGTFDPTGAVPVEDDDAAAFDPTGAVPVEDERPGTFDPAGAALVSQDGPAPRDTDDELTRHADEAAAEQREKYRRSAMESFTGSGRDEFVAHLESIGRMANSVLDEHGERGYEQAAIDASAERDPELKRLKGPVSDLLAMDSARRESVRGVGSGPWNFVGDDLNKWAWRPVKTATRGRWVEVVTTSGNVLSGPVEPGEDDEAARERLVKLNREKWPTEPWIASVGKGIAKAAPKMLGAAIEATGRYMAGRAGEPEVMPGYGAFGPGYGTPTVTRRPQEQVQERRSTAESVIAAGAALRESTEGTFPRNFQWENRHPRIAALTEGASQVIGDLSILAATGGAAAIPIFYKNAMAMGQEAWDDAKTHGADDEQALQALVGHTVIGGWLEAVPYLRVMRVAGKPFGAALRDANPARWHRVGAIADQMLKQGGVEGLTEGSQRLNLNVLARAIYDEDRDIWQGVKEDAAVGAIVGALAGGASGAVISSDGPVGRVSRDPEHEALFVDARGIRYQREDAKWVRQTEFPWETAARERELAQAVAKQADKASRIAVVGRVGSDGDATGMSPGQDAQAAVAAEQGGAEPQLRAEQGIRSEDPGAAQQAEQPQMRAEADVRPIESAEAPVEVAQRGLRPEVVSAAIAEELRGPLAREGTVTVVQTQDELAAAVPEQDRARVVQARDGSIEGIKTSDGRIVLVAGNLDSEGRARTVLRHEKFELLGERALGRGEHARLVEMMAARPGNDPLLDSISRNRTGRPWAETKKDPGAAREIAREGIARIAENPDLSRPVFDRAASYVRGKIRSLPGLGALKISEAEVRAALAPVFGADVTVDDDYAEVAGPKRKERSFTRPRVTDGLTPVLAWVSDHPIRPRSESKTQGASEYESQPRVAALGGFAPMLLRKGGMAPDIAAQALFDEGLIRDPSADALWAAVQSEIQTYRAARDEEKTQSEIASKQEKFYDAATDPRKKSGKSQVPVSTLNVGDVVTVHGEDLKVVGIDPDTFAVTLEDGKKFGIQTVGDQDVLWVEEVERARAAKDSTRFSQITQADRAALRAEYDALVARGASGVQLTGDEQARLMDLSRMVAQGIIDRRVRSGDAIRRTVTRAVDSGALGADAVPVAEDPQAARAVQSLEEMEEFLGGLASDELERRAVLQGRSEGDANDAVMARIVAINRARAEGRPIADQVVDLARTGTFAGQLLRQMAEFKTSTPEGQAEVVQRIVEKRGRRLTPAQLAGLTKAAATDQAERRAWMAAVAAYRRSPTDATWADVGRTQARADAAARAFMSRASSHMPPDLIRSLETFMQMGVLSPSSLVMNVVGNITNNPIRFVAETIAATVDAVETSLMRGLGLKAKRTVMQPAADLPAYLSGFGSGIAQGARIAATGSANERSSTQQLAAAGEISDQFRPLRAIVAAISDGSLPVGKTTGKPLLRDRAALLAEGILGSSSLAEFARRGLAAGDRPFYEAAYRRFLSEWARMNGLSGDALAAEMRAPRKQAAQWAEARAKEAVYQADNPFSDVLQSALRGLAPTDASAVRRAAKLLLRPAIMFVKTPTAIVWELSQFANPVFAIGKAMWEAKTGNRREANLSLGRAITGSMLIAGADVLLRAGLIGVEAKDDKERALRRASGVPPRHINISGLRRMLAGEDPAARPGDVTRNFTGLGVFGMICMIQSGVQEDLWVQAAREAAKGNLWTPKLQDRYGAAWLARELRVSMDMAAMKGTQSLLQSVATGEYESWFANYVGAISSVALPGTLRTLNRATMSWLPDLRGDTLESSAAAQLEAKTWQWGDRPPTRDLWGRRVRTTPEGFNPWTYWLFDPTRPQRVPGDAVSDEIRALYEATGDPEVVPSIPAEWLTVDGRRVELTREDGKYDGYLKALGNTRRMAVEGLLAAPGYRSAPVEARALAVRKALSAATDAGREAYLARLAGAKAPGLSRILDKEP